MFLSCIWWCSSVKAEQNQTNSQYSDSVIFVKHFYGYNLITTRSDSLLAVEEISKSFPNPFAPSTDLEKLSDTTSLSNTELIPFYDMKFQLDKKANVKITIIDSQDNQIRLITDRTFDEGKYDTRWKSFIKDLEKGVYYFKIESSDFSIQRGWIIIR
jgi:hypothetical protein